jgi:hypothetical protein
LTLILVPSSSKTLASSSSPTTSFTASSCFWANRAACSCCYLMMISLCFFSFSVSCFGFFSSSVALTSSTCLFSSSLSLSSSPDASVSFLYYVNNELVYMVRSCDNVEIRLWEMIVSKTVGTAIKSRSPLIRRDVPPWDSRSEGAHHCSTR